MKSKLALPIAITFLVISMLACSAVSNLIATPTPVPTSTPISTPTPLPTRTPLPSPTGKASLFEATDFTSAGCFSLESTDNVERFAAGGAFHLKIKTPNFVGWALCKGHNFTDFVMEADATQVGGPDNNGYGIVFRYDTTQKEFYAFNISGDGYYALGIDGPNHDKPDMLVDWTASSAINKGKQTNHLKAVVVGGKIDLYANDQLLTTVQNTKLTSGEIGFFGFSPEGGGSEYSFDNLKVTAP